MNLSKPDELQMTYLGFMQTDKGLAFSVDGKETPTRDLEKSVANAVSFVTHFSYKPIIAKIEILDPKEYIIMSLNLPIMPAFLDISSPEEIALLSHPEYQKMMKERAKTITSGESKKLIEKRTSEYMNYIEHEMAGAYINSILKGKEAIAKNIQKLPNMRKYSLANFSFSGSGRIVYKTPQFLKFKTIIGGEPQVRNYYMGLQENVSEAEKTEEFWDKVTKRDIAYITLDESMNSTLSMLEQIYGETEFMGPNASLNYTEVPAQKY